MISNFASIGLAPIPWRILCQWEFWWIYFPLAGWVSLLIQNTGCITEFFSFVLSSVVQVPKLVWFYCFTLHKVFIFRNIHLGWIIKLVCDNANYQRHQNVWNIQFIDLDGVKLVVIIIKADNTIREQDFLPKKIYYFLVYIFSY